MTMAVGPLAVAREHLAKMLSADEFAPGARLPTERDLAADIGVSRAVVRSALDELAAQGRVVRHVGRGTFVAPRQETFIAGEAVYPSPAEIMTSRLVLEPEMLPVAVASATHSDLLEMRRCLAGGEAAHTSEEFEHWDTMLHHSFAVATHNSVLIGASQLLIDSRRQPVWGSLKKRTFTPETRQCYCAEHAAIVAAVEDRDPDAAREAMRTHLRHVRINLLGP
ncbi:FadR/GntR family transcriptional regulator [Williamsia serinedens]|uniref:DNA-binding transcriptional regulator, FadR family n=1 Tax=Williamsia serinedens TaxID=391736 RepID=A0ABT1H777_9NOCA|nr:FCD domain-containing protein [Williamsia serinedens]MCP2163016.1 DNA-binding transcriptional regulator, FadR family [Williamsia serinedens]